MNRTFLRTVGLWVLVGIGLMGTSGGARADLIFDNFANPTQGFGAVTANTWLAQRFNSDTSNLMLTSANLILYSGGGSGTFFVRLFSDAAGQPGSSLATLFSGPDPFPGPFPQNGPILFDGLSLLLEPTTNYWLVLGLNAGPALDFRWGATSINTGMGSGFQPIHAQTLSQGAGWTVSSSSPHKMQLTASPIPEPASMLLGLVGSGGLLLVRRRKIARQCHQGT